MYIKNPNSEYNFSWNQLAVLAIFFSKAHNHKPFIPRTADPKKSWWEPFKFRSFFFFFYDRMSRLCNAIVKDTFLGRRQTNVCALVFSFDFLLLGKKDSRHTSLLCITFYFSSDPVVGFFCAHIHIVQRRLKPGYISSLFPTLFLITKALYQKCVILQQRNNI